MAAELVPVVVLAPVAGALVDRVRNRQLLIGSLLLQAAAVAVAALAGLAPGRAGVLLVALVVLGAGTAVTGPTVLALLPQIAGEQGATRAYGWFSALTQAGGLGGFALAGVLVGATSVATALEADAVSYALMALAVAGLRAQRLPDPAAPGTSGARLAGLSALTGDRVLLIGVVGLAAAILAAIVVNVAEVFFVLQDVGAGPTTYGLITAVWPAAGIAGGWVTGRLSGDRALLAALAGAGVVMGAGLLLAAAVVSVATLAGGWVLGGIANAAQRVSINALIRSRVADAERGRAFAAASGIVQAANLLGLAAGAGVVARLGARGSLLGAGSLTAVVGALMWVTARPALESRSGGTRPPRGAPGETPSP
jgi:MFS family permease